LPSGIPYKTAFMFGVTSAFAVTLRPSVRLGSQHSAVVVASRSYRHYTSRKAETTTAGNIPVIDFSRFVEASSNENARESISRQVVQAFKTSGFIYLKNHGLSRAQVQNVFQASASFFALSKDVKERLAWKDSRANRGYVAQGRERVTNATDEAEIAALRESSPDYKESLEIGREVDALYKNDWPTEEELPGFREIMLDFREKADKLHLEVLRSIAIGLDLDSTFFDEKCNEEWHTLRLLHYPSIPAHLLENGAGSRAGSHSDYGCLTLLFQDNVGGLQVEDPASKEYVTAPPMEDTIVINVGDLLARWSNDTLKSTLHRVVSPEKINKETGMTPAR
jgi:isopenicillin N synthase-like dioxygenase